MIFANPAYDANHNTAVPGIGTLYESVRKPWLNIGLYHYDSIIRQVYCPIGPRLLCTVGHIGSWVGQPIVIQGLTVHVTEVIHTPGPLLADLDYCKVDTDIPIYFPRIRADSVFTNNNNLLVIGCGIGVNEHLTDAEGWMYVTRGGIETAIMRWGINKADLIGLYNPYPFNPVQEPPTPGISFGALFRHHDEGHPESIECSQLDSGAAAFLDCGSGDDLWVYVGPVGGGGHDYLSPYKDNVQTGYSGTSVQFDEEFIDYLNGVVPVPPDPPDPPVDPPPEPPPIPEAGPTNPPRGVLIDMENFAGTTLPLSMEMTSGTASWYVANGKIQVSGFSSLLDDRIEFVGHYTSDENLTYEVEIIAPSVITDASSGAYIGFQTANALAPYSVWAGVDFARFTNGTMRIYAPNASTIVKSSSTALGIASTGSPLRLTLRRSRSSVIFTVTNLASNAIKTITFRYPETLAGVNHAPGLYPPSMVRPAISTGGGVWSIYSITLTSGTRINPRVVILGDAVTCGLAGGMLGGPAMRWTDHIDGVVSVYAGTGDGYTEANTRHQEVIALAPELVLVAVGADDILLRGSTASQAMEALNTLRTTLVLGHALPVKIMTPLPCAVGGKAAILKELRDLIMSTHPDEAIDVYSLCADGAGAMVTDFSTDGRHPNALGHLTIGRFVAGCLG